MTTDWRKLLVDEELWDYRLKAVPVPVVRESVEQVVSLRADLAAAKRWHEQSSEQWRVAVGEAVQRAERAEAELAAARALLGEVREWIPYYRWIPDLRERVDAIIGKKTP